MPRDPPPDFEFNPEIERSFRRLLREQKQKLLEDCRMSNLPPPEQEPQPQPQPEGAGSHHTATMRGGPGSHADTEVIFRN